MVLVLEYCTDLGLATIGAMLFNIYLADNGLVQYRSLDSMKQCGLSGLVGCCVLPSF